VEQPKSPIVPSTYECIPAIVEERRFEVASETFPSACGWLMRTPGANGAWGDWMGIDYDVVAASGFTPWAHRLRLDEFQTSNVNSHIVTTANEIGGALAKPEDSNNVSAKEIGSELVVSAGEVTVPVPSDKELHVAQSPEAKSSNESLISTGKEHSLKAAMIQQIPDCQQPPSQPQTSVERDSDSRMSPPASFQSPDGEETPSQRTVTPDNNLTNDVSIGVYTKSRILESVMKEFRNNFFSRSRDIFRRPSDGSESNSSSDVPKTSSSVDQVLGDRSSIRAGKKRAQDRDPISEDEDDGNQKRHKWSIISSTICRARRLACPFNKHDPRIYSPSNEAHEMAQKFRACGGPGWPTVARLK
jgi:hypothetical protein